MFNIKFVDNENKYFLFNIHDCYEFIEDLSNYDNYEIENNFFNIITLIYKDVKKYIEQYKEHFIINFIISDCWKFNNSYGKYVYFKAEVIFNDLQSEILYKLKN